MRVFAWCVFALALAALAWLGLVGALFAAAIALGVPWTTAAVAVGAAHVLAATLAVLVGVRIGRTFAPPGDKASHAPGNRAA